MMAWWTPCSVCGLLLRLPRCCSRSSDAARRATVPTARADATRHPYRRTIRADSMRAPTRTSRLKRAVAIVALLLTLAAAGCGKSDPVYFGCGGSHHPCPGEKTDPNTAMCDAIAKGGPNSDYQ